MLIIDRPQTEALLDLDALRRVVAAAMADVSAGSASLPPRVAAGVPEVDGMLLAMPAYVPGVAGGALAAKLVSLFPRNAGGPVPTHQAAVVVFDPATGTPTALVDGTSITAARTAAGSALSVELLARPDAAVLAILGTGVQARSHALAVTRVRPFTEVRVAGRSRARAAALADELAHQIPAPVVAAASYAEACAGADVVCATTHSPEPVVIRDTLAAGVHVTSVGYNVNGREVDAATIAASLLVVESRAAVLAPPPSGSNDLRLALEEGAIDRGHIAAEIGEIVAGRHPGRTSPDEITLYKSVGVAAQDAAAAALVVGHARERGVGVEVDL